MDRDEKATELEVTLIFTPKAVCHKKVKIAYQP